MKIAAVFVGLLATLLAVPSPEATAGYPTTVCNTYQTGYGYSPSYAYPAGYYPATYSATPYIPAVQTQYVATETFYQVGAATTQKRLAEEVSAQTLALFKAELQRQADAQAAAQEKAENRAIQQQILQALLAKNQQPTQALPAVDPDVARLRADNEKLRATLEQIVAQQRAQQTAPPPPAPPAGNPPPNAPQSRNGANGGIIDPVAWKQATVSCMPCHDADKAPRMNLTDPTKLKTEDVALCLKRMKEDTPKEPRMPKGKDPVGAETWFAFNDLLIARTLNR